MQNKPQVESQVSAITFSQDTDQELSKLNAEMRIGKLVAMVRQDRGLSETDRADMMRMFLVLADLFSTSLPPIEDDLVTTLQNADRDIKLSRLLKERGLVRIYQGLTMQTRAHDELTQQDVLMPAFMLETNPETGLRFKNQEEFIGWFCKQSGTPRSLVFMRISTYDRLLTLPDPTTGQLMTLEEAFQVILKKPYAAREALKAVATWERSEMVGIDPDVAVRLARVMLPETATAVEGLARAYKEATDYQEQDEAREELIEAVKPALRKMVEEVAEHPSMRDVMDMVRHDLAGKPEIKYFYDEEHQWFKIEYIVKKKDIQGTTYVAEVKEIALVPEVGLPREVVEDLIKRLNVRNRDLSV